MRRRQQPLHPVGDTLPQTMQAAEDLPDTKARRKKGPGSFYWSLVHRFFTRQSDLEKRAGIASLSSVVLVVVCVRLLWNLSSSYRGDALSSRIWTSHATQISRKIDLLLPSTVASKTSALLPSILDAKGKERQAAKNFGGLEMKFLDTDGDGRIIHHDPHLDKGKVLIGKGDDDVEYYYAFDDDAKRNPVNGWFDRRLYRKKRCRRTNWHRDLYLNCNSFHELGLLDSFRKGETKSLGEGSYREVFSSNLGSESIIFKICNWDSTGRRTFNYEDYEFMRMDMVVAERFSSNPYFVDIYGFCGLSMFSELMPHGDLKKYATPKYHRRNKFDFFNETTDVQPLNDFEPSEKLIISLQMAEAVAFMHNYKGGVIVHDDIQLPQFLMTSDGKDKVFNSSEQVIKLNDFNRAEIMLFDEKNHEYCRYRNGAGNGDWRAPEEYRDKPLDEKIDIWSLGCNMYALLTGMDPFYDIGSTQVVKQKVKDGEKGFIDNRYRTRSFAEKKLAEAIDLCWEFDPNKRIDIQSLVKLLREAVRVNDRLVEKQQLAKQNAT